MTLVCVLCAGRGSYEFSLRWGAAHVNRRHQHPADPAAVGPSRSIFRDRLRPGLLCGVLKISGFSAKVWCSAAVTSPGWLSAFGGFAVVV